GLMAIVANPFEVCTDAATASCSASSSLPWAAPDPPPDGRGPNPLLQNHLLMAVHPPVLYLGYVGMTVPFAFAISALALGHPGAEWLERTRRWTLLAWAFLTAGIVLGGWWSYEVLGWGGYWAWDPVENASFLPWLTATAFLHSAIVQARRGMLGAWNVILVIATFSLTILGTFLTRSGTIASVHSFTQSAIGPALLGFLLIVLVGSLTLFALRAHLVTAPPRLDSLASREGLFLSNNLLLSVFAFAVLTGTLFPLFLEAFSGDQVSVGRPFFDRIAIPLSFALLVAMGLGPITPYRSARPSVVWERIRLPIEVALGTGALLVLAGYRDVSVVGAVVAGVFVVSVISRLLVVTARSRVRKKQESPPQAVAAVVRSDPGFWGGQLSHVGVALIAIGIAFSTVQATRQVVSLEPGQTTQAAGFDLTYRSGFTREEPSRSVVGAQIEVSRDGRTLTELRPRLNQYFGTAPVTTPAVATFLPSGDLYLSLRAIDSGGVVMEVSWFPLVWLVWLGGLTTAAGGLLARAGRRTRSEQRERRPEVARV
ncbi:MAG: heme lyase CcmF/NrfE family subunit, partial [Acidimicrobiia bacterium]